MAGINDIVTRGYGSFGSVNDLPTRGYSAAAVTAIFSIYKAIFVKFRDKRTIVK